MKFSLNRSKEILYNTPAVLSAFFGGLSEEWFDSDEGENTWTPKQVLAHLIVCEETDWLPRIRIILHHPETAFAPIDMQAHFALAATNDLQFLLDKFDDLRKQSLEALESFHITSADLLKTGTHPKNGLVTLEQLLATWVCHDMTHIAQIARVIAKQYKGRVGTFEQYLSILKH